MKLGMSPSFKLLYTRRETAEMLSLSLRTLDTLIATKQLRVVRVGRSVRVPLDAIRAILKRDHTTDKGLVQ
jgi:excisionase family DNA binding protein